MSRNELSRSASPHSLVPQDNAHNEVFMKMITFFCTLKQRGCAFSPSEADLETVSDNDNDSPTILADDIHNSRHHG